MVSLIVNFQRRQTTRSLSFIMRRYPIHERVALEAEIIRRCLSRTEYQCSSRVQRPENHLPSLRFTLFCCCCRWWRRGMAPPWLCISYSMKRTDHRWRWSLRSWISKLTHLFQFNPSNCYSNQTIIITYRLLERARDSRSWTSTSNLSVNSM